MNAVALDRPRSTFGDWIVPLVLALGGFVLPLVGWFIALYVLWRSPTWTQREKLIGTFSVPGGAWTLFFVALLLSTTSTTDDPAPSHPFVTVLLIALVLVQAFGLATLWRRAWIQR